VLVGSNDDAPWCPTDQSFQVAILKAIAAPIYEVDWVSTGLPGGAGTYYFAVSPDRAKAEIAEIVAGIVDAAASNTGEEAT